jgi:hypothetical protein
MIDSVSITIKSKELIDPSVSEEFMLIERDITLSSPIFEIDNIDITSIPALVQTTEPHMLQDNDLVILGGVDGSVQLNSNLFLVRIIDDVTVALYYPNVDEDALDYDPVEGDHISSYSDNGVIFKLGVLNIADMIYNEHAKITVTIDGIEQEFSMFENDIVLTSSFDAGTIVSVTVDNTVVIKEASEFRIEIDRKNDMSIYRVPEESVATITDEISLDSDKIYVDDITKFQNHRIVLVNSEKIFYSVVDVAGSYISGLIRGVATTGIIETHPSGSRIDVITDDNLLPRSQYNRSWHTMIEPVMGDPLQDSDTTSANFLT